VSPHFCRYFEDDEEEHQAASAAAADDDLEYLPAPGSPSLEKKTKPVVAAQEPSSDSDSDDPLESFMADIEVNNHCSTDCFFLETSEVILWPLWMKNNFPEELIKMTICD